MNSEKLNSWLGVLANIGVLVGIVFLAIEVRHSSNAVSAQMADSVADGFIALNITTITDPAVARINVIGMYEPERLSDVEAIQFSMLVRGVFNQYARVHRHYRAVLLPESDWALYAREAAGMLSTPGGILHFAGNEMSEEFLTDIGRYRDQAPNADFRLGRETLPAE